MKHLNKEQRFPDERFFSSHFFSLVPAFYEFPRDLGLKRVEIHLQGMFP